MRNIVFGAIVATTVAIILIVPSINGISTWKYVLAAIGLVMVVRAGARKR